MRFHHCSHVPLALLVMGLPLPAQESVLAFRGATIIPIVGSPVVDGVLVVRDGKIVAVGGAGTAVPAGATVHEVAGKVIMPGLVDTHSHIGGPEGADRSSPMQGGVRVIDAIDVRSDNIQRAQAGGITVANLMPGSGHLMSGQTAYLKLRDGRTIYDLLICDDVIRGICGGMKMANGTNPRGAPPFPGTRGRAAALAREKFVKAREYQSKIRVANGDSTKLPARDLEMDALVEVLDGRRVVHFHTHRHDDILTAIRLRDEFGFRMVLQHVSEAWKVAEEIAAAGVPASIIVIDAPGGKEEAIHVSSVNGSALEKAGALVAYHTDDGITDSRFFLRSAAFGVREGMSRQKALEALTIAPARMMDLQDRVGSLEAGKDADFIVLSGDPLSVYTHVEQTWVDGRKVFDRGDARDRLHAVGGAGTRGPAHAHVHAGMEGHE